MHRRGDQSSPQALQPLTLGITVGDRHLHGGGETRGTGGIQRPGAYVALLTSAMGQRRQPDLTTSDQCTDPDRAAQFVPGHGHQIEAAGGEVHRQVTHGLHRIAVRQRPGSVG